jgi:hypothetical protein
MCRFDDYRAFVHAWETIHPQTPTSADEIDAVLHAERWDRDRRRQAHHTEPFEALPDGAFVLHAGEPWLVRGDRLRRWSPAGYVEGMVRPSGMATVITPPSLVSVLRTERDPAVPFLHPTAGE